MRQDKIIFDGENPFNNFTKCKELTVLLGDNNVIVVGSLAPINIMMSFNSTVKVIGDESGIRTAYTIPLSLITPLFRLDTKVKDNVLIITTDTDSAKVSYNGVEVNTDIYAANGLTLDQVSRVSQVKGVQAPHHLFIQMADAFGANRENFFNVQDGYYFVSNERKCLLMEHDNEYPINFSLPVAFVKAMKSFEVSKLMINDLAVATTKSGLVIISNLSKVSDTSAIDNYKFARRIKSDQVYTLTIEQYLKRINLAVQSADISLRFNLTSKYFELVSVDNESVRIQIDPKDIRKDGEEEMDFFAMMQQSQNELVIDDAKLVRSLASFGWVKIKVCPSFLVANLGKQFKLMFTLMEVD